MGKASSLSPSHTCALNNRHLQGWGGGDCALAVCQGRTIYPADDVVEEKRMRRRRRRRRRAAVRRAVAHRSALPTCQHSEQTHDGRSGREGEGISVNPLSFGARCFQTLKLGDEICRRLPLWAGKQPCNKESTIPSNSPQTDLWCRNMGI